MVKRIKRILIFIYWVLSGYSKSLKDLITLKSMFRGDYRYSRLIFFSKTLLFILLVLFFLSVIYNSKHERFMSILLYFYIAYLFFLNQYVKEEWLGWYRKTHSDEEKEKRKPWYLRKSKKEVL